MMAGLPTIVKPPSTNLLEYKLYQSINPQCCSQQHKDSDSARNFVIPPLINLFHLLSSIPMPPAIIAGLDIASQRGFKLWIIISPSRQIDNAAQLLFC